MRFLSSVVGVSAIVAIAVAQTEAVERRSLASYLRGPYYTELFTRHNRTFRVGAALHFSHAKQHDVLLLTPPARRDEADTAFDRESVEFLTDLKARTEPEQEYYAPFTARAMWRVLKAIDWTHMLHEQTYDIMADPNIPWSEKKRWVDRAVRYYLDANRDVAFSPAPLDVTLRRAAVMMKPYATLFRNISPKSNNFFYGAHWWHPVIYEAMMISGNGRGQEEAIEQTEQTFFQQVLPDRPQRMLLLREAAPRYSRLSPEAANIFDNLHMFHGIVYDTLSYDGWSIAQKRAELYRVINALSNQAGDEQLARKFATPHGDMDPRVYEGWMKGSEGEMSRIMMEMMDEMMPSMMAAMSPEMHERMMDQFKKKMIPGMQDGELPGSLHDAMMKLMPNMKMMPESMEPGATPQMMVDMMLKGWREKHGSMPDAPLMSMDREPTAPPARNGAR